MTDMAIGMAVKCISPRETAEKAPCGIAYE
jgi:hypothetical protein